LVIWDLTPGALSISAAVKPAGRTVLVTGYLSKYRYMNKGWYSLVIVELGQYIRRFPAAICYRTNST